MKHPCISGTISLGHGFYLLVFYSENLKPKVVSRVSLQFSFLGLSITFCYQKYAGFMQIYVKLSLLCSEIFQLFPKARDPTLAQVHGLMGTGPHSRR